jgi:cobalt/nickel transport system permease protein
MHIPDNFLSTPVWASLDAVSISAVALLARRAGRELDDARIPLLGVMGAFVFAAQMINFPVAIGTSAHLVGGALLACILGTPAAALVMTAIIAIQAFVFQDGGVLALGANVFNMAIVGVFAAYLPIHFWGTGRGRIFVGAFLSVMASGSLALAELLVSGIAMPRPAILISCGVFAVNGLIEGAITVAVLEAIQKLNPGFVQKQHPSSGRAAAVLSAAALLLGTVGFVMASSAPDGIQRIGAQMGLGGGGGFHAPLADYTVAYFKSSWLRRASAGLAGLLLIYGVCLGAGRWIGRQRSA